MAKAYLEMDSGCDVSDNLVAYTFSSGALLGYHAVQYMVGRSVPSLCLTSRGAACAMHLPSRRVPT